MSGNRLIEMYTGNHVPWSYSLQYDKVKRAILVRVAPETATFIRHFFSDQTLIERVNKNFTINFASAQNTCWGAGGCIEWQGGDTLCCSLPVWQEPGAASWNEKLFELACTLDILFGVLNYEQPRTSSTEEQFLLVTTMVASRVCGFGHGGLAVRLASYMVRWIKTQQPGIDQEVTDALQHAAGYLAPCQSADAARRLEECRYSGGTMHMHVIGSCACLGPNGDNIQDDSWSIETHNVDMTWQQLNLLVGVAVLETRIRRESPL